MPRFMTLPMGMPVVEVLHAKAGLAALCIVLQGILGANEALVRACVCERERASGKLDLRCAP